MTHTCSHSQKLHKHTEAETIIYKQGNCQVKKKSPDSVLWDKILLKMKLCVFCGSHPSPVKSYPFEEFLYAVRLHWRKRHFIVLSYQFERALDLQIMSFAGILLPDTQCPFLGIDDSNSNILLYFHPVTINKFHRVCLPNQAYISTVLWQIYLLIFPLLYLLLFEIWWRKETNHIPIERTLLPQCNFSFIFLLILEIMILL